MRLVVLGATGPTGLQVVEQALAAGHEVVAYVRQVGALPTAPGLTVELGQLTDEPAMAAAFAGASAVVVCLGVTPGPGTLTGVKLMTTTTPVVLAAMAAAGVRRVVWLSAFGVGASRAKAGGVAKAAYATLLSSAFGDKVRGEDILTAADVDWTLVYPVQLTDGAATGAATVSDLTATPTLKGLPKVCGADVATVMLDAAVQGTHVRQTVVIRS